MKKQFAIIGLGRFGASIGEELMKMGHQVLAIEKDGEKVDSLWRGSLPIAFRRMGRTRKPAGSGPAQPGRSVIIAISQIESSIFDDDAFERPGSPVCLRKSHNDMHTKLLYKVGADRVVFPERDMGIRLAHQPGAFQHF